MDLSLIVVDVVVFFLSFSPSSSFSCPSQWNEMPSACAPTVHRQNKLLNRQNKRFYSCGRRETLLVQSTLLVVHVTCARLYSMCHRTKTLWLHLGPISQRQTTWWFAAGHHFSISRLKIKRSSTMHSICICSVPVSLVIVCPVVVVHESSFFLFLFDSRMIRHLVNNSNI